MNFPLRVINKLTCNQLSETELQATEKRIDIIRKNQSYNGVKEYPKIAESLKHLSSSLLTWSDDENSSLANIISALLTTQSHLGIHIKKLKEAYKEEGEKIKSIINAENQTVSP